MLLDRYSTATGALVVLALACVVGACSDDDSNKPPPGTTTGDDSLPTSPDPSVRFKSGERLKKELARALEIDGGSLCQELGKYDCFPIHKVILGESDAFGSNLYEALPSTTATSPLAAERVILSACSQRATLDVEHPESAVVFVGLPIDASGRLSDLTAVEVDGSIDALYRRGLGRHATQTELDAVRGFYANVEAESSAPARDWAALSCFSVMSTMEALFY